ncbi:MAG: hypothetical protein JWM07_351 [Candidatus Saccharibacteria bacterium]|nr:hypothetical protein [Candidatus Saccharibacteria bacterium]
MSKEIEITGIRKDNGNHDNPHEAIEAYRWVDHGNGSTGLVTRTGAVKWIEDGNDAYVAIVQPRAYCYVNVSANGNKFLQTYPDALESNNLLQLPEVKG